MPDSVDLRHEALTCLLLDDAVAKAHRTRALAERAGQQPVVIETGPIDVPLTPGRPDKPELVAPKDVPRRRNNQLTGHATLIHAICHIEFNAINLALDAIARFEGMPRAFYLDWLRVADEEAKHFGLLRDYLRADGFDYGDFPAHNGLWEMAQKTADDALARMALVPRVLEARGLDVTPGIMEKLKNSGNHQAVEILALILEEEIGHVAIGSRWFNYLCARQDCAPAATFAQLLEANFKGALRGPFHLEARREAGFSDEELDWLAQQA